MSSCYACTSRASFTRLTAHQRQQFSSCHKSPLPSQRRSRCRLSTAQWQIRAIESATEEAKIEDVKPSFFTLEFKADEKPLELYIGQLQDGRLNLEEVFMIGSEDSDRIRPTITGDIETEPAHYDSTRVETMTPGSIEAGTDDTHEVDHLILTKIVPKQHEDDIFQLDFRSVYCFNCKAQEFYRAEPLIADDIVDPVLRFQVEQNRFIIDESTLMPAPPDVSDAADAKALGVSLPIDVRFEDVNSEDENESGDDEEPEILATITEEQISEFMTDVEEGAEFENDDS